MGVVFSGNDIFPGGCELFGQGRLKQGFIQRVVFLLPSIGSAGATVSNVLFAGSIAMGLLSACVSSNRLAGSIALPGRSKDGDAVGQRGLHPASPD